MIAVSEMGDMDEDLGGGERAVRLAGILCRTPDFWDFMIERTRSKVDNMPHMEPSEDTAKKLLKRTLNIKSRAEIKDDPILQRNFHKITTEYNEWLTMTGRAI